MDSQINVAENFSRQLDEVEALSSIYGEEFIKEDLNKFKIIIKEDEVIELNITFPPGYPSFEPPQYEINAPWLKGEKRKELCCLLDQIYTENLGECVIYMFIEQVRTFLQKHQAYVKSLGASYLRKNTKDSNANQTPTETVDESLIPEFISGEIISDRKSTFQPHLAPVFSVKDVKLVVEKLNKTKKIEDATHNMFAYRIKKENVSYEDCDDDGEKHAGERLLHLLHVVGAENVLVMVSRWYGGIQLGPDRFKHINNAARQILVDCGYIKNKTPTKR